jgi:ABC-type antimicrobial peptide transport system permease subunit
MLERIKELTGIYSLGFDKASMMGIMLPLAFVIIVGGGLSALVLLM